MSKTVLHVVGLYGVGGVQSQFDLLAPFLLSDSEFCHKAYSVKKPDSAYKAAADLGVGVFWLLKNLLGIIGGKIIIHSYNNVTSKKYGFIYGILKPKNLIFHEHGNAWNVKEEQLSLYRRNAALAKYIVCNSHATYRYLSDRIGVPEKKLKVIHNGIARRREQDVKQESSDFRIGYIGRLEPHKGVHCLLQALNLLPEWRLSNIKVSIAGAGSYENVLRCLADQVSCDVDFLGRLDVVDAFYEGIDLLVVPSVREPLGNVIIEAAQFNVPVIAANVDGIPEIITNGKNGILIEPSVPIQTEFYRDASQAPDVAYSPVKDIIALPKEIDPIILSEILEKCIDGGVPLTKMAQELNKTVLDRFSVNSYLTDFSNLYRTLKS